LHLERGDSTWWGEITSEGKRKRVNLHTEVRSDAEQWIKKMQAMDFLPQHMREDPGVLAAAGLVPEVKKVIHSPGELLGRYRSELSRLHHESKHTQIAYDQRLKRLEPLLRGRLSLSDVTKNHCRAWVSEMSSPKMIKGKARSLGPRTVQETVKVAKGFWRWAVDCGYASEIPLERIPLPKRRKKEKPFWTAEEVRAILDKAPDPETKAFWGVMAYAGLRHEEAYTLTWNRVDLKANEIRVFGKMAKVAEIPISKKLKELLLAIKPEEAVAQKCFPGIAKYDTSRMRVLVYACRDMKFIVDGPVTFHRLRHSFGSNLIRAGVAINKVSDLMRHDNIKITLDDYAHLLKSDFSGTVDLL